MMPDAEKLLQVFILLGIPVTLFTLVLVVCLALWIYPQFKLFMGDLLRLFGKTSKWLRRKSIGLELEGSINSFRKQFNSGFSVSLLPECTVQWVTPENAQSYAAGGKAIVKLSFGDNHDQNFYNVASSFVELGVLPRAKTYLQKNASKAIDLLMLRNVLARSRRTALNLFNTRFREEGGEVKERFYQCEETDRRGLFSRILLQEYHFWGEALGEKAPDESHIRESEQFWDWFYELATRETEEMSELSFRSSHINIGVILIAHSDTYEKYGKSPYLRWAYTYAANNCQCLYLISGGKRKSKIVKEIAHDLVSTGCFQCITRKPDFETCLAPGEPPVLITCIALRPSWADVVHRAWQQLQHSKEANNHVLGSVRSVSDHGIVVDVSGLLVNVENKWLSLLKIEDAGKYFSVNDELLLRVEECDANREIVVLSNCDTETDPKWIVDKFKGGPDAPRDATIEKVVISGEGWEMGLIVGFPGEDIKGFVPRSHATYSRFEKLSERYCLGTCVRVRVLKFDARFKTFVCRLDALEDPWMVAASYRVGNQIEAIVRQISLRYIVCEPLPGVEGIVPFDEISWGTEDQKKEALASCNLGRKVLAKIIHVDKKCRKLRLSLKKVTTSPVYDFFSNHVGQSAHATVTEVALSHAILVIGSEQVPAYMHARDLIWTYCDDLRRLVSVGEPLFVKLVSYDDSFDNIRVSHKHTYSNDFDEFTARHAIGDNVNGKVVYCIGDRVIVRVPFFQNLQVEGYVHKSEISNILYVDDRIMESIFLPGHEYRYVVKRIDEHQSIVELSRKAYLRKQIDSLKYGEIHSVTSICETRGKIYLHGDYVEGFLTQTSGPSPFSRSLYKVFPARIDHVSAHVEFESANEDAASNPGRR